MKFVQPFVVDIKDGMFCEGILVHADSALVMWHVLYLMAVERCFGCQTTKAEAALLLTVFLVAVTTAAMRI